MPRGPKGKKRPANVIGNAVMITGEIERITTGDGANAAAAASGLLGGRRGRKA